MEIRIVEENGVRFIEGVAGEAWLRVTAARTPGASRA